jgi:tetratricopeptide (TPR) repeat protein
MGGDRSLTVSQSDRDFFVSYAGADRAWALWISQQLVSAGYTVELDVWDWPAGSNFINNMEVAIRRARRMVAVLSDAYFDPASYAMEERAAALRQAKSEQSQLLPVKVASCELPPLIAPLIYVSLVDLDEEQARSALLDAARGPSRPDGAALFPGTPRTGIASERAIAFPGFVRTGGDDGGNGGQRADSRHIIDGVPPRNRIFTGRDNTLEELRRRLTETGSPTVLVPHTKTLALHGTGGVGKTQLATEYAHRYRGDYDITWWIPSEQPELIAERIAGLAPILGLQANSDVTRAAAAVIEELSTRDGWLLIFDNVESLDDIAPYVRSGRGHIVITSRMRGWGRLGEQLAVDVFHRDESIALLRHHLPEIEDQLASGLAEELGDLPLAIEQVAAYLEETDTPVETYLRMFRTRAERLLADGYAVGYQHTIATAWGLSLAHLEAKSRASAQILTLAAFCAPDAIPLLLFTTDPDLLDSPLQEVASELDGLLRAVGMIIRYSLARREPNALQVHRLLQAAVRAQLSQNQADDAVRTVRRLLQAAAPTMDPETDTAGWKQWMVLLPHILAATMTHAIVDMRRDDTEPLTWLLNRAGRYLQTRGELDSSLPLHERAVELCQEAYGPDHPQVAVELFELTWVLRLVGKSAEGHPLAERALAIYEERYGPKHPKLVTALVNLAQIRRDMGQAADAYPLLRRALAIIEQVASAEVCFSEQLPALTDGAPEAAEQSSLSVSHPLVLDEAMYDPDHPEVGAGVLVNVAQVLTLLGRADAAYPLASRALTVDQEAYGVDHPRVGSALVNLGLVLRCMDRPADAYPLLEHALAIYADAYGLDHPRVAGVLVNLAQVMHLLGRSADARRHAERALEIYRRFGNANHPETATALESYGIILRDEGHFDDARSALEMALTIFTGAHGEDDGRVASVFVNLAVLRRDMDLLDEAIEYAKKAYRIYAAGSAGNHPEYDQPLAMLSAFIERD